jgi:hypothetical protein
MDRHQTVGGVLLPPLFSLVLWAKLEFGCISFIATARTEGNFIDLKWMKKVEDFRSRWFFVDILKESELFLITGIPPVKLTTWASKALPEEALKMLRPRIRDLRKAGVTGTMVRVEFVTRCIAPCRTTTGRSRGTGPGTTSGSTSASSTPTLGRR